MTIEGTNAQPTTETGTPPVSQEPELQTNETGVNDLGGNPEPIENDVDDGAGKEIGEEDKGKDGENELFGKPETYDYKEVQLPEGMALDESMTGKLNEFATKTNLSQKGANELAALGVELSQQIQQQTVEAMGKLQEAKIQSYLQLLNTDKEVGGAKYKESIETANLAYDAFFGDEELRTIIAESGANKHPKFIKALKAIGSQMKQDTIHSSTNPSTEKQNREDILYPSMSDEK
jgi:hypothetical protein